ncbi:MAG: hypothetical protein ACP5QA_16190 [Phycisphaerae bacterium]
MLTLRMLALLVAAIGSMPFLLYILGKIKDPFHPLVLLGAMGATMAARKLLFNPDPALSYVRLDSLQEYLAISAFSMLALYYGWHLHQKKHAHKPLLALPPKMFYGAEYDVGKMLPIGAAWAVIALGVYILTYHRFTESGYLRDLWYLRIPAVILLLQAILIDRSIVALATFFILVGIAPDLNHIRNYGGRGSTAMLFDLAMVPYFFLGRRPRKSRFLLVFFLAGIALLALAGSRTVLGTGQAHNRISAIYVAAKQMILRDSKTTHIYSPGRSFVVGAAEIQLANDQDNWDNGGIFWNFGVLLLPHELFPQKSLYYTYWGEHNAVKHIQHGVYARIPLGVAPTGFASVFIEFHWLFPMPWLLLGYWLAWLYRRAVLERRLSSQAVLVTANIICLYLVAQDCFASLWIALLTTLPTYVAYKYCRLREIPRTAPNINRSRAS